jgi:CHAD domain-containing protein
VSGAHEVESRLTQLRGGASPDEPDRHAPAGQLLVVRLREQLEALLEADLTIRAGDPRDVHDARVACRRLRAVLATSRSAVRAGAGEALRDELGWLAQSLGGTRDQQVARERLLDLAHQEGQAAEALVGRIQAWDSEHADGAPALATLASQRYVDLLDALHAFVADPPWAPEAERDAGPFLRRRIRNEWGRLEDRAAPLAALEPGTMPDERLHDARKAAKRLRYTLEVAQPLWKKKAKRLRAQVHRLTDTLGERQDTVVSRAILLELAGRAEAVGEPDFAHGRLHQSEESRAAELEEQFRRQWAAAVRRRSRWP